MPLPIAVAVDRRRRPRRRPRSRRRRATTPTGSRLEPCSRRTRAAPSSTTIRPRAGFAYLSQSLKLDALPGWAAKRVPTGSPAAAAARVPGAVPLQITAGIPASLAISAAATLLRMPPEPKAEVRSPISSAASSAKSVDLGDQLGGGVERGSAVRARRVGEQDQQAGVEQERHLGGEEVVVAEADLVGGGGVVLVDHRHHPPLDQPPQRLAGVQVVGAGGDVGRGQQHLRRPRRRARRAGSRRRGRGRPGRPPRRPAARPSPAAAPAAPSAASRGRSRPR